MSRSEVYAPFDRTFKRFFPVESESDRRTYAREFSGRMTKARWKRLSSFCRRMCWTENCGHEWDCCGCMFSQTMSFIYKQGQVVVTLENHYNY